MYRYTKEKDAKDQNGSVLSVQCNAVHMLYIHLYSP